MDEKTFRISVVYHHFTCMTAMCIWWFCFSNYSHFARSKKFQPSIFRTDGGDGRSERSGGEAILRPDARNSSVLNTTGASWKDVEDKVLGDVYRPVWYMASAPGETIELLICIMYAYVFMYTCTCNIS